MVVPKAELFKDKLRLYYTPELLMETLTLSATQGKSVIWTVPPRSERLIDGLGFVQVAHATLAPIPTGRASPTYATVVAKPVVNPRAVSDRRALAQQFMVMPTPDLRQALIATLPSQPRRVLDCVEQQGPVIADAVARALTISDANAGTVLLALHKLGLIARAEVHDERGFHYLWSVQFEPERVAPKD